MCKVFEAQCCESSQTLKKFEEDCKQRRLNQVSYSEYEFYWNGPIFEFSEKECTQGKLQELYSTIQSGEVITTCRKLHSCKILAKALDMMYPDSVKLEAAIVGGSLDRDGFLFTFKTGILSILIGSWAGSASVLATGLISQGMLEAPLAVAAMVVLMRMFAMFLRTRHDLDNRRKRVQRDRTRSNPRDVIRIFQGWHERYSKKLK